MPGNIKLSTFENNERNSLLKKLLLVLDVCPDFNTQKKVECGFWAFKDIVDER